MKNTCGSGTVIIRDTPTGNACEQGVNRLHHWDVNGDRRTRFVFLSALVISLILCGCSFTGEKAKSVTRPLLPPMPWNIVQEKKPVRPVEKLLAPQTQGFVVEWENQASPFASNYVTGIEATEDLQNWQEVATLPYTVEGRISLTNDAGIKFLRVFNTIRP